MLVVDFVFKENLGQLKNCVIFKDGDKLSVQNEQVIIQTIEKDTVMFGLQNKYFSGKTHIDNIEHYKIHKIGDSLL